LEVLLQLIIATEQRFLQCKGEIYTETIDDYLFWRRYLDVFSSVQVVARMEEVVSLPKNAVPASGESVNFVALPNYNGPLAGLLTLPQLLPKIKRVASQEAAFILRIPGAIGTLLYRQLRARQWPFAVEVGGDPYESLSPKALRTTWSYLVRPVLVYETRRQCHSASSAAYVTYGFLQQRYPSTGFSTHYSNVELPAELFERIHPRYLQSASNGADSCFAGAKLIFVGSLSQRYKGLDILLRAVHQCVLKGVNLRLKVLGDGACRSEYEQLVDKLGLGQYVTFHGYVAHEDVWRYLCQADLFVMPSLAEGLPRAMIEAMVCGLPCIGSNVGGIPELLAAEDMFPVGDSDALAQKIMAVVGDEQRRQQMGQRNRQAAMQYRDDILQSRRNEFYKHVRDVVLRHVHE
jgi:glycosyltransferase involved in cell wall biosynthesis